MGRWFAVDRITETRVCFRNRIWPGPGAVIFLVIRELAQLRACWNVPSVTIRCSCRSDNISLDSESPRPHTTGSLTRQTTPVEKTDHSQIAQNNDWEEGGKNRNSFFFSFFLFASVFVRMCVCRKQLSGIIFYLSFTVWRGNNLTIRQSNNPLHHRRSILTKHGCLCRATNKIRPFLVSLRPGDNKYEDATTLGPLPC